LRSYQGGDSGWGYYHHVFMIKKNDEITFEVYVDLEWYRDQKYQNNNLTFEDAKKIEVAPFKTFQKFDSLIQYIFEYENAFSIPESNKQLCKDLIFENEIKNNLKSYIN